MRKIGPRLRSATEIILMKELASTSLGHRYHKDECIGLGFARPCARTERSRGHFHPRKSRSPSEVEDGPRAKPRGQSSSEVKNVTQAKQSRSPSEAEGICIANDDNSFLFHRNIAPKQIAIFECLQITTQFKYNK